MNDSLIYIDHYFNGELLPEEKKTFEHRCLTDPAFAKMVAFYVSLHDHLKEQWTELKKQEFASLEETGASGDDVAFSTNGEPYEQHEIKQERSRVSNSKLWKGLAIAAAASGIIALGSTWYENNSKSNATISRNDTSNTKNGNPTDTITKRSANEKEITRSGVSLTELQGLFAQNFKPDITPEEPAELLENAFYLYKTGSYNNASRAYEEALAVVSSLEVRTPGDKNEEGEKKRILFYAHYYNALSYLAGGNEEKAISELNAIKESPNGFWQAKSQWYLALAYLKNGDIKNADALLRKLQGNKQAGEYMQKAANLGSQLSNK